MNLRRLRLKPGCAYHAEARMGNVIFTHITFETDGNGRIKSFGGTYTCNSPEMFDERIDLFHFRKILNVTTGESWDETFNILIPSEL